MQSQLMMSAVLSTLQVPDAPQQGQLMARNLSLLMRHWNQLLPFVQLVELDQRLAEEAPVENCPNLATN